MHLSPLVRNVQEILMTPIVQRAYLRHLAGASVSKCVAHVLMLANNTIMSIIIGIERGRSWGDRSQPRFTYSPYKDAKIQATLLFSK